MLKEIKEKEFVRINGMLDSYQEDINTLTKQAEKVDEKYRKLAEKEKKDINEAIEFYKSSQQELIKRRDSLGVEAAKVDKKVHDQKAKEAEETETVVDTLFPENNAPAVEEPVQPEVHETISDPVEEPSDLDAKEDLDWDEKIESGEVSPVEKEESTVEVNDIWEEETEEANENEDNEVSELGEEDWPEQVEEWK